MTFYSKLNSPSGEMLLVANESELTGIYFDGCSHVPKTRSTWKHDPQHSVLQQTGEQLHDYFAGRRNHFSIPMRFAGTEFQEKIWREIAVIPFGKTISYSELAHKVGKPKAVRAAGTSTGRNPLSIVIPCHRVVGKNGGIAGYAGGLDRKRHLLKLENIAGFA